MNEYQWRMIVAGLLRVIDRLCDEFCKKSDRIPEVREARAALTEKIGETQ